MQSEQEQSPSFCRPSPPRRQRAAWSRRSGPERLGLVPGEGLWDGDSQAGNSLGSALVVGQRERPYCHLKNLCQEFWNWKGSSALSQTRAKGLGITYALRRLVGGAGRTTLG